MYKFSKTFRLTDGVIRETGNQPKKVVENHINVKVNKTSRHTTECSHYV